VTGTGARVLFADYVPVLLTCCDLITTLASARMYITCVGHEPGILAVCDLDQHHSSKQAIHYANEQQRARFARRQGIHITAHIPAHPLTINFTFSVYSCHV
jgi:hypothetical protein